MKHHKKIRYRFLAFTVCRTRAPTIVALCLLVLFIGACQNATPVAPNATPLGGGYVLTHTMADAEYLLSWDTVVGQCPDIVRLHVNEGLAWRGESLELHPGLTISARDSDSPQLWDAIRNVEQSDSDTGNQRTFGVRVSYFESENALQKHEKELKQQGWTYEVDGTVVKWFAEDSGHFGDTKEFATLGSMVTGHQLKISLVSWTMAAQEEGQLEPFCGRSATQRLAEDVAGKLGNVLTGTDAKPRADPAPPSADAAPEKVAQWLYGVIQDPVGDQSLKEANSSLAQQLKVHILDSLEAGQTVTRVIEILVEAHGANIVSSPCAGGNLFPQSVRDRCRLLSE